MNQIIPIKPAASGAGSQPEEEDGATLEFISMPSEMTTYSAPVLPEPEEIEGLEPGIDLLSQLHDKLLAYRVGSGEVVIDLTHLDEKNRAFINEAFGDGEVGVVFEAEVRTHVQESVLAGVWRVQYLDKEGTLIRDTIEIADIPGMVRKSVFSAAKRSVGFDEQRLPEGLMNATSLITEINDKVVSHRDGDARHVINLSLLPHTQVDLTFIGEVLGSGPAVILSRGYGNCRITSTATKNVWWVQYFNSQDALILNTIEITEVPDVACASQEDIDDSAQRMGEILDVYR